MTRAIGCTFNMGGCGSGPGLGATLDLSAHTTLLCKGRARCVFPAGSGNYSGHPTFAGGVGYPDYCVGFLKFWWARATCVAVPASPALPPPAALLPPPPAFTACSTGLFQSGVMGTLSCPANMVLGNITAVAGGSPGVTGACGAYSVPPCSAGPGAGNRLVFSSQVTAACSGLNTCTFPAGTGGTGMYADFCFGG